MRHSGGTQAGRTSVRELEMPWIVHIQGMTSCRVVGSLSRELRARA